MTYQFFYQGKKRIGKIVHDFCNGFVCIEFIGDNHVEYAIIKDPA
jgi:hypothetical protein